MYRKEIVDRFWAKVDKSEGCWIWTGATLRRGYGAFQLNGRACRAHRVAYEMAYGSIPSGLFVCHSCDNPACVRPDHLWLGSAKDNTQDCIAKGRMVGPYNHHHGGYKLPSGCNVGERNPRAKMTRDKVIELRARYSSGCELLTNLANEFGIAFSAADKIVRYETWKEA